MQYNTLGNTGLLKASVEAGVNFFDTADVYSEGESEKIPASPSKTSTSRGKMSSSPPSFSAERPWPQRRRPIPRAHHGRRRCEPAPPANRLHRSVSDPRRSEFDFPLVDKERTWKILDVIAPIAKAHGCSPARISLAWILSKPFVTSIIIGAKSIEQLNDNLASAELKLSTEEIRQLDEVSTLPLEYPGWMLPFQDSNRRQVAPRPQTPSSTQK